MTNLHNLPVFGWAWSEQTSGTQYEIVQTDAELAEREEWISYVASLEPEEDPIFERDLDMLEASEAF